MEDYSKLVRDISANDRDNSVRDAPSTHGIRGVTAHPLSVAEQWLLTVTGLSIRMSGHKIVRDIRFALPKGASFSVIGPNGSGKTLFVKTLLGLLPRNGNFHWMPGVRLGYVPQKVMADPQVPMLVRELVEAKCSVQNLTSSDVQSAVD